MRTFKMFFLFVLFFSGSSCSNLDEELRSTLEEGEAVNASEVLVSAYEALNPVFQQDNYWAMQEISTDEAIAPTRGGDWDDNGIHRALHLHTWNADNSYMNNTYEALGRVIFRGSNVLENNPTKTEAAEARFIRALGMFAMIDLWGISPYRDDYINFEKDPDILSAKEGLNFIIEEVNSILQDLPSGSNAAKANQNAARVLLMKVYLNRAAFLNRESPQFEQSDMNEVIKLANEIQGYTLSEPGKYFDNFAPDNDELSTENIFTLYNKEGERGGDVSRTYNTIAHYNMTPGGWNGWATLGALYDKFEAQDERRGINYSYKQFNMPNPAKAVNVGFLVGQQYDYRTGEKLMARNPSSAPLDFTYDISIRTSGATLETAGIRVLKYAYDYASSSGQKNNDWVIFRYADVLLMEAEAILRGGNGDPSDALDLVNEIRANRNASQLSSLDLDVLLDERARELYWEGHRRQDLIRFGKFLEPWTTKPNQGTSKELLYAIPSQQLSVNFNLEQNPGYDDK